MTICVLALDAADYELAKQWDCQNMLLDQHQSIETFSWSKDEPYTPEVWATVATGVSPEIHGIGEDKQEVDWDNLILRLGSQITKHLPPEYRQRLGRPFRELGVTHTFNQINETVDHPFDAQLSWPGLGEAKHLKRMWETADDTVRGNLPKSVVHDRFHSLTGQELGWLKAMDSTEKSVVGAHAHILDIAGHLYAERPDRLREWYEWVDAQLDWLREECDQLVILSDHGIQTSYLDDPHPGSHSWRPFISSQGIDAALPESVYDVKAWLEAQSTTYKDSHEQERMDTPTETLENLGYI